MEKVQRWFLRRLDAGGVPTFDQTVKYARRKGAVKGVTNKKLQKLRKRWLFTSLYSPTRRVESFQTIAIPKMGVIQGRETPKFSKGFCLQRAL